MINQPVNQDTLLQASKQASKQASNSSLNNDYFLYQPLAERNKPEFLKSVGIRAFCFSSLQGEKNAKNATHFVERCNSFSKIARLQTQNGNCGVHFTSDNEAEWGYNSHQAFLNKQEKDDVLSNQLSKEFSPISLRLRGINPNLW